MEQGVSTKRKLLEVAHKRRYSRWFGCFNDDRLLFCNIYEMLIEALGAMEHVENNLIHVGFNRVFKEEFETLDRIAERFAE